MPRVSLIGWLKEKCSIFRAQVIQGKVATDTEIDAYKPGGERNNTRGALGLLMYYTQLVRWDEVARVRVTKGPEFGAELERAMLKILRRKPETIELIRAIPPDPNEEGAQAITHLNIYPKSLDALLELDYWDYEMNVLGPAAHWLRTSSASEDMRLYQDTSRRIHYVQQVMVWILTTGRTIGGVHYTAACPYTSDEAVKPLPPAYLKDLDGFDLPRVLRAHLLVNAHRLQQVHEMTRLTFGALSLPRDRATWSMFYADRATNVHEDVSIVADRWDLASFVATAALNAKNLYEARQAAERQAQEERGAA